MLRAAVFDLDHTLFDPHTLPRAMFDELEARVRAVAVGHVSATVLDAALADAWRLPFDRVMAQYQLPKVVRTVWEESASALRVTQPLSPYSDVPPILEQLALRRFLLTTGFRQLQESKIRQLGLATLFAAVYIDALDPPGRWVTERSSSVCWWSIRFDRLTWSSWAIGRTTSWRRRALSVW